MKANHTIHSFRHILRGLLVILGAIAVSTSASAGEGTTIDDFSAADSTSLGTLRLVFNDAAIGGKSSAEQTFEDGLLRMEGKLVPGRGQPGFISLVLLLSPQGKPEDLSAYEGIHLRVRVLKGSLSVLAASSKIENFDYHTKAITRSKDFQDIRIPFTELKRIWSEQVPLDLTTITSINLVASTMQPGDFLYEVDEVGLY